MEFFKEVHHPIKYVNDLCLEWTYHVSQGICEILKGVALNMGVSEKEHAALLRNKPETLEKGIKKGFESIIERLHGFVGKGSGPEPFRIKDMKIIKKNGRTLTHDDWKRLNWKISQYWKDLNSPLLEEVTAKGFLLGLATAEAEAQRDHIKSYGKKSLVQLIKERFKGYLPKSFEEYRTRVDVGNVVGGIMKEAYSKTAMYVSTFDADIKEAIRQQIVTGHKEGKTAIQIASDLYWMKDNELKQYTAPYLMRDFHRIAVTELAGIHTTAKLAPYEERAFESLTEPDKAVYLIFTRGTCTWCQKRQGTVVRLVPRSSVKSEADDSLSSMGIQDPYTTTAVWIGKNNIGFKADFWRVCTPAHPYNTAVLERFFPEEQEFDQETKSITMKDRFNLRRFIPERHLIEVE